MGSLVGVDGDRHSIGQPARPIQDGCLQDIHWPSGSFGYFPSYTLGAMYAAQFFASIRRANPDLDTRLAAGDLSPVFDWLQHNIWQRASRWSSDELVQNATGENSTPHTFGRIWNSDICSGAPSGRQSVRQTANTVGE